MIPKLTLRGSLVLVTCALGLVVGAARQLPGLVAVFLLALVALLATYVQFYPAAVLLRRRHLQLSWWPTTDHLLTVGQPVPLRVLLTNQGPRAVWVRSLSLAAADAVELLDVQGTRIAKAEQAEVVVRVRFRAAGYAMLHGVRVELGDVLGLFSIDGYFPSSLGLTVFPERTVGVRRRAAPVPATATIGVAQQRSSGTSGELRELRELSSGDPLKLVAWRASAKRGKLMVRDLYEERDTTTAFIVDIGANMRGLVGQSALDWGLRHTAAWFKQLESAGQRYSLRVIDTRLVSRVAPGAGPRHWRTAVEQLLDANAIVDEDLTSVTASDLVTRVAKYVAHQEGVDVRVFGNLALDDPRWNSIQAGTDGQMYDLERLDQAVGKLLAAVAGDARRRFAPSWWWQRPVPPTRGDKRLVGLRTYCRLRGIALPYQQHARAHDRSVALSAALTEAAAERPEAIVLISNLHDWSAEPAALARAVGHVRRVGARIQALVPPTDGAVIAAHSHAAAAQTMRDFSALRTAESAAALRRLGVLQRR